jgi:predicted nucleic acid-binding protein
METWRQTGRLLYELRRIGQVIPLADALIAVHALKNDCEVYARDEHFQRVPRLKLHEVGN